MNQTHPNIHVKKGPKNNPKSVQNKSPKSRQLWKIGTPTFGLIFDQFWTSFWIHWTSILESILYLILDHHFGPVLDPILAHLFWTLYWGPTLATSVSKSGPIRFFDGFGISFGIHFGSNSEPKSNHNLFKI